MSNLKSWRSKWQHSSVFHTVIYSILITPTQPEVHLSQWDSFCPSWSFASGSRASVFFQLSLILGWIPLQWLMAAATSSACSEEVKGQIDEVTWKQKERTRRHAGPLLTCEALRDNQLLSEPTRAQPGLCVYVCLHQACLHFTRVWLPGQHVPRREREACLIRKQQRSRDRLINILFILNLCSNSHLYVLLNLIIDTLFSISSFFWVSCHHNLNLRETNCAPICSHLIAASSICSINPLHLFLSNYLQGASCVFLFFYHSSSNTSLGSTQTETASWKKNVERELPRSEIQDEFTMFPQKINTSLWTFINITGTIRDHSEPQPLRKPKILKETWSTHSFPLLLMQSRAVGSEYSEYKCNSLQT